MTERIAIITALILERPLCFDCLCAKAGMKPLSVNRLLGQIGRVVKVHRMPKARCRSCGENRPTVSVDRSPREKNDAPDPLLHRALALLRSRADKGVCTKCLGEALGRSAKDVQTSLQRIEQHAGFSRQFGTCAICEKHRLVLEASDSRS